MKKDSLIIFDTTLRDGEQSAGAGLTVDEKLIIAKQLESLGVDVIEAGFAVSSIGDFNAVRLIAETVKNCKVASLARVVAPALMVSSRRVMRKSRRRAPE